MRINVGGSKSNADPDNDITPVQVGIPVQVSETSVKQEQEK